MTQATATITDVTAAQLASTSYVSGSGTDQLYVRANDGSAWSPWQAFTATGEAPAIVNAGATLELATAYASQVTFFGSTGTLKLDNPASFAGTVAGMTANDTIDFTNLNPNTIQTPSFAGTSSGGTLTVTDGTRTDQVALLCNYLASTFVASSDGHGGTSVIDPPAANQNPPARAGGTRVGRSMWWALSLAIQCNSASWPSGEVARSGSFTRRPLEKLVSIPSLTQSRHIATANALDTGFRRIKYPNSLPRKETAPARRP